MMKLRRFFYHFNRGQNAMTVHYEGKCHSVKHVECIPPCETKWNNKQPYLIMRGWAYGVDIVEDKAIIW